MHCIIGKEPERKIWIKSLLNKHNWEGISYSSGEDDWKMIEKDNLEIALNIFHAKKKKHILLIFQKITRIVKKKLLF